MLFPARAALDSIQFSRRLGDSIRILRTALAGGSSWIRTSVIFHNATRVLYHADFHNRLNKEPLNTFLYACKAQALIVTTTHKEYNFHNHNTIRIKLWQTSLLLMI